VKRTWRNRNERQSVEALEQLYGYMTFNNLRYGILTNWTRTYAVRRIKVKGRKALQYAGPFTPSGSPSMLKVVVGMVLLAEEDWFYASPTPDIPPPSRFLQHPAKTRRRQSVMLEIISLCLRVDHTHYCHLTSGSVVFCSVQLVIRKLNVLCILNFVERF